MLGLERPFGITRPGPGIGVTRPTPAAPEAARVAVATALTSAREEVGSLAGQRGRTGPGRGDPRSDRRPRNRGEELFGPAEDVAATYRAMLGG